MSGIGTLQWVDESDLTTVLFDCNDDTGVNNERGLKTFTRNLRLGQVDPEIARHAPADSPGGFTAFSRDGLVQMSWRQGVIEGQSFDQIAAGIGVLQRMVRRGGVLRWIPEGSADTTYIDAEPSSPPGLFVDEADAFRALTSKQYLEGLEVDVMRQPYLRGAQLAASVNVLLNATMLRDSDANGTPDGWTLINGTHTIDVATASLQISHGAAVDLINQDFTASAGTTFTASIEGIVVSGTRTARLQLVSRPSGAVVGTVDITATAWGTRVSCTGTIAGGDTSMRVKLAYAGGSGTTVIRTRNAQMQTGSVAGPFRTGVDLVAMDPAATGMAKLIPVFNPWPAWAALELDLAFPDSGTAISDVLLGLMSDEGVPGARSLVDFLNGPFYAQAEASGNGWTVALGTNVSAQAVGALASGSGSDVARINHATDPGKFSKKITWTRTTRLDGLRGEFDVWARVKPQGAEIFYPRLRWGPDDTTPPTFTLSDGAPLDATGASSHEWVPWKLGRIRLPLEQTVTLGTLKMELWTKTSGTDQDLDVDYIFLLPADQQAHLTAPERSSSERWLGRELATPVTSPGAGSAGVVIGDDLFFNTSGDNAGTPPAGGAINETGRHICEFALTGGQSTLARTVKLNIRNVTDSVDTISKTVTLPERYGKKVYRLKFDAVAGKTYQAQVDDPTNITGPDETNVSTRWIRDSYRGAVSQNERLRSDPRRAIVERLASGGAVRAPFGASKVPFWIPPGSSLLAVWALDLELPAYDVPTSVLARTVTVSPNLTPMRHA